MNGKPYAKEIAEYENAIVTPTVIDRENSTFCGCVYDESGSIVPESQRASANVNWIPADPRKIPVDDVGKHIDGRCLYLGHYTGHYGHFLLETLSRFWVFETDPVFDYVLFSPFLHRTPKPSSFSPADTVLNCFSIKESQFKLIRGKTSVKHLILPTHLIDINSVNRVNQNHREVFAKIKNYCCQKVPETAAYSQVYLSRRKWHFGQLATHPVGYKLVQLAAWHLRLAGISTAGLTSRRIVNEAEVERLLSSLGFAIISPEKLSFPEQVATFSKTDLLVGFDGSAMHNSLFMPAGSKAVTISRGRRFGPNQRLCNMLAQVEELFIEFKGRIIDSATRALEFDLNYLQSQIEAILKKRG